MKLVQNILMETLKLKKRFVVVVVVVLKFHSLLGKFGSWLELLSFVFADI